MDIWIIYGHRIQNWIFGLEVNTRMKHEIFGPGPILDTGPEPGDPDPGTRTWGHIPRNADLGTPDLGM